MPKGMHGLNERSPQGEDKTYKEARVKSRRAIYYRESTEAALGRGANLRAARAGGQPDHAGFDTNGPIDRHQPAIRGRSYKGYL